MIVAVDPGLYGALVANDHGTLDILDMPTTSHMGANGKKRYKRIDGHAVAEWLEQLSAFEPDDFIILELAQGRQGEAAAASFNYGQGFGLLQGIFIGLAIPCVHVRPQVWVKAMGVGPDKNAHRAKARELFPAQADLFKRVKDDGRADAALMTLCVEGPE